MSPLRTAARSMLASTFIIQGWKAFNNPKSLADRARPVTERLAPTVRRLHPSAPTDAETLVRVNGAAQVVGGVLLATGRARRTGALILAGSMVPTTLAGHAYWTHEDPSQRAAQRVQFLKNVSLLGGLLIAALDNEGRPGVAWRAKHGARRVSHIADHAGHAAGHWAGHASDRARRAAQTTRRAAHTSRREARIALRAAKAGRGLPF